MTQHHQPQWHNVVPKRVIDSEDGPDGGAVLLVPRFRKGPFAKWLQPRLKRPHIRVKLDDFGSFVWRKIDGKSSFCTISKAMTDEFGERITPADERLQKFLTLLQRNKFAELYTPVDDSIKG